MSNLQTNPRVDPYFTDGCGRCPLGSTPDCRVHRWPEPLRELRRIALESGLTEQLKWGVPVYTVNDKNIALLGAFKADCVLGFFKGVLLTDPHGILTAQSENIQESRVVRFTEVGTVLELEPILKAYIAEAVQVELSGLKVQYKTTADVPVPEEFQTKLDELPALKTAFEALTPGRQRAYLYHFSQPKQSKTRAARVEKYVERILAGKGLHD
jgi:uncharacterized protein YdeI (YjbR/CyaY-like superfamily)